MVVLLLLILLLLLVVLHIFNEHKIVKEGLRCMWFSNDFLRLLVLWISGPWGENLCDDLAQIISL